MQWKQGLVISHHAPSFRHREVGQFGERHPEREHPWVVSYDVPRHDVLKPHSVADVTVIPCTARVYVDGFSRPQECGRY